MAPEPIKYLLVSLPTNISLSNDRDEALTALRSAVQTDFGTTTPFPVPAFKIGTLDALVQQADDLAKLCNDCETVVGKVGDSLGGILEGDRDKINQQKKINDRSVEQYLSSFSWNKVKYRIDKPIGEMITTLRKELVSIDNDVKAKFSQYNTTKNNLTTAQRKQTGNLSTKSLLSVVNPEALVQDSEYLDTHLIAVPKSLVKDYIKSYEKLCDMVVPRSSVEVASDSEFTLFAVTTFKKMSAEFIHRCREKRWTPRDFHFKEGSREEETREVERLGQEERKLWGEALRLGHTGYSDSAMTWMHALALRVFVETVLRYGLPAEFVCGLIRTTPKLAKKVKGNLDASYMYLGGNAMTRDKKGRVVADPQEFGGEGVGHEASGEYTPYVYYDFELD